MSSLSQLSALRLSNNPLSAMLESIYSYSLPPLVRLLTLLDLPANSYPCQLPPVKPLSMHHHHLLN